MGCLRRALCDTLLVVLVIALILIAMCIGVVPMKLPKSGGARALENHKSPLESAMHERVLRESVFGVHDLSGKSWGGSPIMPSRSRLPLSEPGVLGSGEKQRRWEEHESWQSLAKDRRAYSEYFADRAAALDHLEFDWTDVLKEVLPKLSEKREYVGLVNLSRGAPTKKQAHIRSPPKKLELVTMEASPTGYGEEGGTTFASVPYELLDRVASRPALFIFHTHADHTGASPLPSSTDISTAVTMGYNGRYAAWVLVSRYGVFIYTPSWQAYKDIHGAKDPALALKHYRHDTVAAFEGIRSWAPWTLDDYSHLYQRHKILYVVYPSPAYVADSYLLKFVSKQEAPDESEILATLRREIGKSQKTN